MLRFELPARTWSLAAALVLLGTLACGGGAPVSRGVSARSALAQNAELVEFDTAATRAELFREIALTSLLEAGKPAMHPVFFPVIRSGEIVAAAGIEPRVDLFATPDAGTSSLDLVFDVRGSEGWPEDRRDNLQGLSEREAAELVARWLLSHWGISPEGTIQVDRASGAPYAAAYVDGILRVNPAFLYMASVAGPSSLSPSNQ
jgi:hypothetical protein